MIKLDAQAILDVLPAAKKKGTFEGDVLTAVQIARGYCVATDGCFMLVSQAPEQESNDLEAAFIFDKTAQAALKIAARLHRPVTVDCDGQGKPYLMSTGAGTYVIQRSPYQFPAWRDVLPSTKSKDQRIGTLSTEYLAKLEHLVGGVRLVPCGNSTVDRPIVRIVGHPRVTGILMGMQPPGKTKKQTAEEAREAFDRMNRLDYIIG